MGIRTWKIAPAVELVANVAIVAVALIAIFRLLVPAAASPGPPANSPPKVENIESQGLSVGISDAKRQGSPQAKLVFLEFSDYECPFCGRFAMETYEQIQEQFVRSNRAQYVFRNFPLDIHKQARPAASAAECAGEQGAFWHMRDHLFANQKALSETIWMSQAEKLRLDMPSFSKCLTTKDKVLTAEMEEGRRLGVQATPTFFIGRVEQEGQVRLLRRIRGAQTYETFAKALTTLLKS